jgi:PAS domain S-box-containing protein
MAEAVLACAPLAIVGLGRGGRVLSWNPAAERMFGWTEDQVLGRPIPIVPEGRRAEATAWWDRAFAGEVLTGLETIRHRADGGQLSVAVSIAPLPHDGILSMYLDISDRVRSEQLTRHVAAELGAVVDGSPVPIGSLDRNLTVVSWNAAAARMFGWTFEEVRGRFPPHVPPELVEEARASWLRAFEGHDAGTVEVERVRRDGQRIHTLLSAAPIRDESGEITRLVFLTLDVTERKRAEDQLARYCQEVEESRALAEGQAQDLASLAAELDQARNLALESVRLKSAFLATMSHEIRTPLNGVIGMTGLLLDTPLTKAQLHYAETARSSGEALLGLINDILDFSKIEAGKMDLELTPLSLRGAIEDVLDLMAERAHAKGIELVAAIAADVPCQVRGDAGRLRQVITNLVGNAVKFTQQGAVCVRVARAESDTIRFEVTDTGIGLSPEAQTRLFQPFSQADESTARKYGGTGLGLAICRQIVELMEGRIGVTSEVGRGSTFWFTATLPPLAAAVPPTEPMPDLRQVRMLVVDDQPDAREALADQLRRWGAAVEVADGAVAAFAGLRDAAAAGRPFQVVLVDRAMPDPDGVALAAAVRHDSGLGRPHIILLTTVEERQSDGAHRTACVDASLLKPVRLTPLAEALAWAGPSAVAAPAPGRQGATGPTMSLRVLLAEDNKVNQLVATQVLRSLGHRVDVASNGLEACEAIRTIPYDVVLMDCEMPELDGFEATRRIRGSAGPRADVPIIAMTANAMEGDRQRCLDAGMNDYVAKPFRVNVLAATLQRWSPEHAAEPAPAEPAVTDDAPAGAGSFEPAVLDRSVLAALHEITGDTEPGFVAALVESFCADLPGRLDAMAVAVVRSDAEAIRAAAHALKGSAGNLGTVPLQHACDRLEMLGRRGNLAGAGQALRQVREEAARAEAALRAEIAAA